MLISRFSSRPLALVLAIAVPAIVALAIPSGVPRISIPMLPLLVGVVFATLMGGALIGIPAAMLAALVLLVRFYPPRGTFSFVAVADVVSLALFFAAAVVLVVMTELLVRSAARQTAGRIRVEAGLAAERDAVTTLQYALLPTVLPTTEGIDLDARYVGATRRDLIGGDWYLALPVGDHQLALAVGDVTGHGIEATAWMAQLRHGMKAYASVDGDPALVVERLNSLMLRSPDPILATCVYGVLDLARGQWTHVNAGHCPPIVRRPDGSVTMLDGPHSPMLGIAEFDATPHTVPFPPGSTLVLYSDGLVERRTEPITTGFDRLVRALSAHDEPVADLCTALLHDMASGGDDDVVVLAAHARAEISCCVRR